MKQSLPRSFRVASLGLLMLTLTACGGGGGGGSNSGGNPPPADPGPGAPTAPRGDATEVGAPTGPAITATIGSIGGSLSSADGRITLHVPAGALAEDTEISVLPIENKAHGGRGSAFRLAPEGVSFALPVQLVFSYTDADLAGTAAGALGVAFQRADRRWQWAGAPLIDVYARTVTVETDHFSDWTLVTGLQLQPRASTLKTGESLALQVVDCYPPPADEDGLVPLGLACDSHQSDDLLVPLWYVAEWAVNGVAGGTAATGTVAATDHGSGSFTAPADVPSPDTVTVSARIGQGSAPQLLLAADVRIVDEEEGPDYIGTLEVDQEWLKFKADVRWTKFDDLPDSRSYLPSGTITFTIVHEGCSPGPFTVPIATGTPEEPAGQMIVYTDRNVLYPSQHLFHLRGEGSVMVPCGDNPPFEFEGANLTVAPFTTCQDAIRHPFSDEDLLTGSFSCPGVNNVAWTFRRPTR